uniref:Glycoside hydrolase family 92 protein n=1 Tax=Arcella intermedia TaxID=1963864 RepID=A0A6B2KYI4_9EUKA|eukprot:TRINITY_DN4062_c0_g1_i1.p1 TRINITY_DN4062_c0_g1~~TRINITY_DN4062_c0_g1_i1.p1  ORF type:complete len:755 (-),score=155.28 TRINITY_DN4062_c0_g1_i1:38-2224(-)
MALVDPFIGTYGDGYGIGENPPGAQRPFGFARVGPDTVGDGIPIPDAWRHNGGYYYGDYQILCFSHTHMVGAGAADYGTIGVLPTNHVPSSSDVLNYGFRSTFNHSSEKVLPGFYSVFLDTPKVRAELTSTLFSGVHRYTWANPTDPKVIVFPISHSIFATYPHGCKGAHIEINGNEVSGWILMEGAMSGRFGGYKSYFVAKFNTTVASYGTWIGQNVSQASSQDDPGNMDNPNGIGAYVVLSSPTSSSIEMYVGISSISVDQARTNLAAEVSTQSFDTILEQSLSSWDSLFSRVYVTGGTSSDQIKFWTAFYHTLNAPSIFSEPGGYYLGFDNKVHQLSSDMTHYYTDMSIWDVYRTEFPWLVFFKPDVMSDIVKSLLLMKDQGGDLPRWPFANGYTSSMSGVHGVIVIVDAWLKGIEMDNATAYAAIKRALTEHQDHASFDVDAWQKYGYIPYDLDSAGTSVTLELAYDNWVASTMAKGLGHSDDQILFFNASQNWKNIWNSEYKFFCPKTTTGEWNCPDNWLDVFDKRYIEGDAWHYRFYVPGDVDGLIQTFGKDSFISELDTFLYNSEWDPTDYLPNPYYWAGNEPDILSAYEFNFAGRADLTQKYVRWLMNNQYTSDPNGLPGNDDYGTMSAWYLWSALGIYPLSGSTKFMIGTPLFDSISIQRPQGSLSVIAYNNSPDNFYVQKVVVNGKPIDMVNQPFLDWSDISQGCIIQFWMTNVPPSY